MSPRPGPPRELIAVRLSANGKAAVQAIADAEHGGNFSKAVRALLAEAVAHRQRHGRTDFHPSPTEQENPDGPVPS